MPAATKLTKPQLELLGLFERTDLPDEDWVAIRKLITQYFAERLTRSANQVADANGWTGEDFERMAREHYRTGPST